MQTNKFFQITDTTSLLAQTTSTAKSPNPLPEPPSLKLPQGVIGLLPLVLVLAWAIALRWSSKGKGLPDPRGGDRRHHKIPCKTCQFFKDNPYIKCAVHPSIAATKSAIECSDYTPQIKRITVKDMGNR